jgi:hypothetical protein
MISIFIMKYNSLTQHNVSYSPEYRGALSYYTEDNLREPTPPGFPQDTQDLPTDTTGQPGNVRIHGTMQQICIAFLMITIPMGTFVALLLGLVYHYRVGEDDVMSPNLGTGTQSEVGAVYVDLSATIITTVASWSSTVAPLLLTFAISLSSFPVARKLLDASQFPDGSRLPTPFQFSLMLATLEKPTASTLGRLLQYRFSWKQRHSQGPAMGFLSGVLCLGLFLR